MALKLKTLILAALVLPIVVAAGGLGFRFYKDLDRQILAGFDNKLQAVSVATGAFIDGDEHRALEHEHRVQGLAWDEPLRALYGIDVDSGELCLVDPTYGHLLALGRVGDPPSALTIADGTLYGLRSAGQTAELLRIDTDRMKATRLLTIGHPCRGLAYHSGAFYCVAEGELVQVDPRQRRSRKVGPLNATAEVTLLASSGEPGTLYGYDAQRAQVLAIDTATGSASSPVLLAKDLEGEDESGARRRQPLDPGTVLGLAFDAESGLLYAAAERLIQADPGSGDVQDVGLADGYRSEQSPIYLEYVEPMRRIMKLAEVTYLYTQVIHPDDRRWCIYVIDAREDEEHSLLGEEEELETASIEGQWNVREKGTVYLGPIEASDKWGLLKTAYAPIYNAAGEVRAIAGADISIDVIREKRRNAIGIAIGVVLVCVLVGVRVAFDISRRITRPIANLKDAALELAAGDFKRRTKVENLEEMRRLTTAFNDMGATLDEKISDLRTSNRTLEIGRRLHEARTILLHNDALPAPSSRLALTTEHFGDIGFASGAFEIGEEILVYLARKSRDKLDATRLCHALANIVRHLQAVEEKSCAEIEGELRDLFPESVDAWIRIAPAAATLRSWSRRPYSVYIADGNGQARPHQLDGEAGIALLPGEALVLTDTSDEALVRTEVCKAMAGAEPDARQLLQLFENPQAFNQPTGTDLGGDGESAAYGIHLVLVHPK